MKIHMPESNCPPYDQEFRVGNVYRAKGGKKTKFFILIGFNEAMAFLLGINEAGEMTSAVHYGRHAFEGSTTFVAREVIGFCPEVEKIDLTIHWTAP